jgi:hypothetical protein
MEILKVKGPLSPDDLSFIQTNTGKKYIEKLQIKAVYQKQIVD